MEKWTLLTIKLIINRCRHRRFRISTATIMVFIGWLIITTTINTAIIIIIIIIIIAPRYPLPFPALLAKPRAYLCEWTDKVLE